MSQEIVNDLDQLRTTFLEIASKSDITCDDIHRLISCTEDFHQNIVIIENESGMPVVPYNCVTVFQEILSSLQQCETFCSKKSLGRPKLYISKDQLEFTF